VVLKIQCTLQEVEQQCQFVVWVDPEWPSRAGESFKKLWQETKQTRRVVDQAHDALQEAMLYTEQMVNAKLTLEAEVQNTKRVACRVCQAYQKKAFLIAMDKSKLLYLTYCLMVLVIVLMVFVVVLKF
jgi:hypothetical protein